VLRQRASSPVVINRNTHRIPDPPVGYRPARSYLSSRHTPILWTVPLPAFTGAPVSLIVTLSSIILERLAALLNRDLWRELTLGGVVRRAIWGTPDRAKTILVPTVEVLASSASQVNATLPMSPSGRWRDARNGDLQALRKGPRLARRAMRRVPAANIATAAGGDIHRERRKTLHSFCTVRPGGASGYRSHKFGGLVRQVASAVSTEAGVMPGFAQVFALFAVSF
jgi:hypothetical protein